MAIAITTPTGNVGRRVTEHLLAAGAELIVLARNPEKLSESVRQRTTVFQGSLTDTAFVLKATQAAEALFWVSSTDFSTPSFDIWYEDLARAAATSVQTHKIPYVVNLSSVGAHLSTGMGPISKLYKVEQHLSAVATNIIHLRPEFFMENYLHQLEALQTHSSVFLPLAAEQRFAMISTQDIAAVAANLLLDRSWSGHAILGLQGPEDLSFNEAAVILSEILGKQIKHIEITSEQFHDTMVSQGASLEVATQYAQMWQGLSHPDFAPAEPRTPETTKSTTFAEFACNVLKPLYSKNLETYVL